MSELKNLWAQLETMSFPGASQIQIDFIKELNCFVGLIGSTGARTFLLEIDASVEVHPNYLKRFKGVEIQVLPRGKDIKIVAIILLESDLSDVFTLFIEDILDKLVFISDPENALVLLHTRIEYWKRLFGKLTGETLSLSRQRGLFGELFVLKKMLQKSKDKAVTLNSWRGSQSSNQDFVFQQTAIEVKTSKAGKSTIHVSNELQLDHSGWENLFLCLVAVNETTGKENSLSQLIDEIFVLLGPLPGLKEEFVLKLSHAGVEMEALESYCEVGFNVRKETFFRIENGFPCLVRSKLDDDAIFDIKYQVDLSACEPYTVSEEEPFSLMT